MARAAVEEGHTATVFLAGDAVQMLREPVLDCPQGLGTGSLREHYSKIVAGGGRFVLSSAAFEVPGLTVRELDGKQYEFGTPSVLVRHALGHDRYRLVEWQQWGSDAGPPDLDRLV